MAKKSRKPNRPSATAALSIDTLVDVLRRCGAPGATAAAVEADIAAGAPTNADGTINLVCYTAWLAKQSQLEKSREK